MEKTNWIVALVVGALVGFFVGHYTAGPSSGPTALGSAVANTNAGGGDVGKTPADLPPSYIKEAEFPAGTFTGLTDAQKYTVLKVANERDCTCGCPNDTIAKCRTHDAQCTTAPQLMTQIINDAKAGMGSAQIEAKMAGPKPSAAAPARPTDDPTLVYKVPVLDSPVRGEVNAPVTIVEFSDYQCPFCGRAEKTVEQIRSTYGKDVRIVYKENPLPFHPHAMPGAKAAVAAGEQGKFWEMHDLLFENQQKLTDADIEGYAKKLGLNLAKWKADMDSPKTADSIKRDMALAAQLGASGTPAFFINGHKLVGAQPFDSFKKVIDEQKGVAEKTLASGTKPADLYATLTAHGVSSPPAAPAAPARNTPPPPTARKIDIAAFNPVRGPKVAPVTIVEWSDFQCPFCSRVEPTIKQIHETYGSKIKFVWRNQPLPFHPHAMPAAKAAMAANEQGKFWEMHDLLFANQKSLDDADIEGYAKKAGLDLAKWKAAMTSPKVAEEIATDMKAGAAVGANGTPTFFINGKEVGGAQPFQNFKTIIDEQLEKSAELAKKGVKPDEMYAKLTELNINASPKVAVANAAPSAAAVVDVKLDDSPSRGAKNAPVTIVEFSDFQCPFCGRGYQTMNQVEKEFEGKINVVFKQNPLPFHNNAMPAAQASLAAAAQGKFWPMYDQLFTHQTALTRPDLDKYAEAAGLNMAQFKADLDSGKFKGKVEAELAEGRAAGVTGTPTFVINGHVLVGAQPIDAFRTAINAELTKAPGHRVAEKR